MDQEKAHTNFVDFYEDRQSEKRERLFLEFNSLSIVYGRPSETFLKDQVLKQSLANNRKNNPNNQTNVPPE